MFSSVRSAFKISQCKSLFEKSSFRIRSETHLHTASVTGSVETNQKPNLKIPVKEISIPLLYGHLAGKAWGQESGYPVLAIHGWMDNCGTFDRLIPLLDKNFYIVALDLPGSGFSSHKPLGCFYNFADMIIAMKQTINFLGWQKFSLIGHSMGGALSQLFAGFYPKLVDRLVILDIFSPPSYSHEEIPENFVSTIETCMEIEKKLSQKPPVYSEKGALGRLIKGMHNEITEEAGKILLHRGARFSESDKGFVFTRDLRLRIVENYYARSIATTQAFMSRIESEMLIIQANNTHPDYMDNDLEKRKIFIDTYKKYCKRFLLETVEGNHFVHLNNPERIAPIINRFISGET